MQGDKLVGIVTETDVLNYFIELLEGGAFVCVLEEGIWGLDLSVIGSFGTT